MSVASPSQALEPSAGRLVDLDRARRALAAARRAGRSSLLEPEGLELLDAIGVGVPEWVFVPLGSLQAGGGIEPRDIAWMHGDRVVIKVVAEAIAHKSELGGVIVVPRDVSTVTASMRDMVDRLAAVGPAGCLATAFVEHDPSIAGELLVALRWTADFGPIVAVGAGGVHAERLAGSFRPGAALALVPSDVTDAGEIEAALRAAAVVRLATEPQRGRPPVLPMAALVDVVERLLALGRASVPGELLELEVNPMAVAHDRLVALDVLARLGDGEGSAAAPRRSPSRTRIDRLLRPGSIAIVGVSSGQNIGRTILRNTLRDGFEPGAITIIKPGAAEIDGCRCVPDLGSLPGKVDLLIVAVSAAAAAELIPDVIERDLAESIIVIPGGLDETAGGAGHARRIRDALARARERPDGGPVLNGGNCMGIRSRPGRYDTLFVPEAKLAGPGGRPVALGIVAQSGAFAISRLSRLEGLDPRYVITVGNQTDLTVGDHLEHLATDEAIRVFGVYVEGFAALDGLRFLSAARAIRARGGTVVLYRAGRTAAGARASASHTAAIAGDALVTTTLAREAGVLVAETLEDFDDLLGALIRLDGRPVRGRRVGAVTNAGFECVAIADVPGSLEVATLDPATTGRLETIIRDHGLAGVVDVHNPFDLTPMADDATYVEIAEAILASPSVDLGLVGNVPFTQTIRTLPAEDFAGDGSVASRLIELWRRTTKPWVAVVDAGPRYDPLAHHLEAAGIPVFRTADAAMRTLAVVAGVGEPR
ncbi:MAG TPA: acetate--CoA ligase family protein [Candidatus Limnocylindrales bacterium]|nr:acetate--CoA ligase family protein [Candidatus Limnocylindrales bacterium]